MLLEEGSVDSQRRVEADKIRVRRKNEKVCEGSVRRQSPSKRKLERKQTLRGGCKRCTE